MEEGYQLYQKSTNHAAEFKKIKGIHSKEK